MALPYISQRPYSRYYALHQGKGQQFCRSRLHRSGNAYSMPDGKVIEFTGGLGDLLVDGVDIEAHFAAHVVEQLFHLLVGAFEQKLDAAVGKVADVAGDVVLNGQ